MARPRLLVVEDDNFTRRVWEIIFGRRGWDVVVAETLAEGLRLLEPAPDYLILDLLLPDGEGDAILRKVRELGLETRVAVTTTIDDDWELDLVRSLCPELVLQKPMGVGDLWRERR